MENFLLAYHNATKGKKHYKEVQEIGLNPEPYLQELLEEVRSKRYKVSDYKIFKLYTGHKWREIYKLPMRDRIVQHAIMNICEPIFRESFIQDTYSSIKTRGIHLALKRLKRAVKDPDCKYCLKLDIRKCYPSLDKEILKQKLARKFNDRDLLWLMNTIIDSCEKGVPIGNYTSQYFNNFYFSDFDHWLKEKKGVKHYFRYCDDMVILGSSKEELHQLLTEIRHQTDLLHVTLKDNWQVFPVEARGVDFLGYITRTDYCKVRKCTKCTFIRKTHLMDFQDLTENDYNTLGSYWGILCHADCRRLWSKYTHSKDYNNFRSIHHPEYSARQILNKPVRIYEMLIKTRRKQETLFFKALLDGKYVFVHTTSASLIKMAQQRPEGKDPWDTRIVTTMYNNYIFT